MSDWADEAVDTLILPSGATTGQRIVLDGTTGEIDVYNNSNSLIGTISPGVGVKVVDSTTTSYVQLQPSSGTAWIFLEPAAIVSHSLEPGQIWGTSFAGQNNAPAMGFRSPGLDGQGQSTIFMVGVDGAANGSLIDLRAPGTGGAVRVLQGDLLVGPGQIYAMNNGVRQTWQTLTLLNGWTASGTNSVVKIRQVASPPNSFQIAGSLIYSGPGGSSADGTVVFQLPTWARPINNTVRWNVVSSGTEIGRSPMLIADTSGNVSVFGCGTNEVWMSAIVPFDLP